METGDRKMKECEEEALCERNVVPYEIGRMFNEKEDLRLELRDDITSAMRQLYVFSDSCDMLCCHELNNWIRQLEYQHLDERRSYQCDLDKWGMEWLTEYDECHSILVALRMQMIELIEKERYDMLMTSPYFTDEEEAEVMSCYYSFQSFREMNCFWLLEEKILEEALTEKRMKDDQRSVIRLLLGIRKDILDRMWMRHEKKRERLIVINELFKNNIMKAYNAIIRSKVNNLFSQPLSYTINVKGCLESLLESPCSVKYSSQMDLASEIRNILNKQSRSLMESEEWIFPFLGDTFPNRGEENFELFLYGRPVGRTCILEKEDISCTMTQALYRLWKITPFSLYDLLDLKDITISVHVRLGNGKA